MKPGGGSPTLGGRGGVAPTAPLLLLPTGIGEARTLARHGLERLLTPAFFPDGSRVVYSAAAPGEARRLYVQSLAGDAPRAVTPPGVNPIPDLANPVSPDGDWVTAIEADGTLALYPVNGGAPRPLRRLEPPSCTSPRVGAGQLAGAPFASQPGSSS